MRIGSESSEAADPFYVTALKPWVSTGYRHLEPSSATRRACRQGRIRQEVLSQILPLVCRTQDHAFGHDAIADEVPQGDEELAG
jgi:hypothetical protein